MDEKYEIVELIKGNEDRMVFLCRDKHTGDNYIMKQFHGDSEVYDALLLVNHRNIPQVFSVKKEEDSVTIIEEYIEGVTLDKYIKNSTYEIGEVRRIVFQILDGLEELHGLGIIHRDLKPQNIIIGKDEVVRIIDYNAARFYKKDVERDTVCLGTEGFAAPEQYGTGQTDERTDFYSLGVIINIMLTGSFPSKKLYQGDITPIIEKCIQVNRERRFKNEAEIRSAFSSIAVQHASNNKMKDKSRIVATISIVFILMIAAVVGIIRESGKTQSSETKLTSGNDLNSTVEGVSEEEPTTEIDGNSTETNMAGIQGDSTEATTDEDSLEQQLNEERIKEEIAKQKVDLPAVREDGMVLAVGDWEYIYEELCTKFQKKYPDAEFYYTKEEMEAKGYIVREAEIEIKLDIYVEPGSEERRNEALIKSIYEKAVDGVLGEYVDTAELPLVMGLTYKAYSDRQVIYYVLFRLEDY